ncbi:MAG: hypothetical protein LUE27_05525 [Clostridia bacterium]|nr:hypothetical protein [Clostridia bacterium]
MSKRSRSAKSDTNTNETLVYVGPTVVGVAQRNTFFTNGVTRALQDAMDKEPAFRSLVIPLSKLVAAQNDISNKRGSTYVFFKKAQTYKP